MKNAAVWKPKRLRLLQREAFAASQDGKKAVSGRSDRRCAHSFSRMRNGIQQQQGIFKRGDTGMYRRIRDAGEDADLKRQDGAKTGLRQPPCFERSQKPKRGYSSPASGRQCMCVWPKTRKPSAPREKVLRPYCSERSFRYKRSASASGAFWGYWLLWQPNSASF